VTVIINEFVYQFIETPTRKGAIGNWLRQRRQLSAMRRRLCGWPLGSPERYADVVMTNLLGDEANHWRELAAEPRVHVHLYGKREARPGRKMGHFNRVTPRQG